MKRLMLPAMAAGLVICAGSAQAAYWTENFDSYANGTVLSGINGWTGWDNTEAAAGKATNARSTSPSNSLAITKTSDAVHQFSGFNTGIWTMEAQMYIPIKATGTFYFNVMDVYTSGGDPKHWGMELPIDIGAGTIKDPKVSGSSLALVTNAWAPLKIEFNYYNDTCTVYYNNKLLSTRQWSLDSTSAQVQAIDLWGNNISKDIYFDDFKVTQTVPEPATIAVLGLGALALIRRRRR